MFLFSYVQTSLHAVQLILFMIHSVQTCLIYDYCIKKPSYFTHCLLIVVQKHVFLRQKMLKKIQEKTTFNFVDKLSLFVYKNKNKNICEIKIT